MSFRLYVTNTRILQAESLFNQWYSTLSTYRRGKVNQMRRPQDKCLSLGAGVLLHRALSDAGLVPESLSVSFTPFGKPIFNGHPDFHFSLSHSEEIAICAISDAPIGCDVEKMAPFDLRIAQRFFASEECRLLMETPRETQPALFCRLWVLKESYLKATGLGLSLPLNAFAVQPGEPSILVSPQDAGNYAFAEPHIAEGYGCACCVMGEATLEHMEYVDLAQFSPF